MAGKPLANENELKGMEIIMSEFSGLELAAPWLIVGWSVLISATVLSSLHMPQSDERGLIWELFRVLFN